MKYESYQTNFPGRENNGFIGAARELAGTTNASFNKHQE
jgi:hypothetical protein